jgi:hypothetical protein
VYLQRIEKYSAETGTTPLWLVATAYHSHKCSKTEKSTGGIITKKSEEEGERCTGRTVVAIT